MSNQKRKGKGKSKWLPKKQYVARQRAIYRKESRKFVLSERWRELREKVFEKYGRRCMKCGATPETGAVIHVDHIKPRSKFPELKWDFNNLQVLCSECNEEKSDMNCKNYKKALDIPGIDWSGTSRT